jgi:uncharacterized membrane-anchored protein
MTEWMNKQTNEQTNKQTNKRVYTTHIGGYVSINFITGYDTLHVEIYSV